MMMPDSERIYSAPAYYHRCMPIVAAGKEDVVFMRKYKGNVLTGVVCNRCGKKLVVNNGIVREGVTHIAVEWDYFSEKDGEEHGFDLCEECYDTLISEFAYPVSVTHKTELI